MKSSHSYWSFVLSLAVAFAFTAVAVAEDKPKTAAETKPVAKPAERTPLVSPIKPTQGDVPYGKHPKQVVDFYQAKSDQPTPVVFFIHGGGWRNGSKTAFDPTPYLKAGVSVVAAEYRFIDEATADGIVPPVKGPLHDAARALQFTRSKAKEWNLDPKRIAATGSSAGACSSLWINFHNDLADPKSDDPVARESTRLLTAAVIGAQTSLDPKQMKEWMPNSTYGGHAFGFAADPDKKLSQFDVFLAGREKVLPWIKEYSPYELVTSDDPPVALFYNRPPAMGQSQGDPTHSANFGLGLQEKCKSAGVPCELTAGGSRAEQWEKVAAHLIAKLKSAK